MFNNNMNINLDFSGLGNAGFEQQQPMLGQDQLYNFGAPSLSAEIDRQMGVFSMIVRKVYLGKTRPQNQQGRRTYNVELDGHGLSAIQDSVLRQGATAFDPENISNLMAKGARMFNPSAAPEELVGIDNGWETERFRFTILADIYRHGKYSRTEFISGYTDNAEIKGSGIISSTTVGLPSDLTFTINHITEARNRQVDNRGNPIPMISRSQGVVRNNSYHGIGSPNQLYLTRPSDVLRARDKIEFYHGIQQASAMGDAGAMTFQDLDSVVTTMPMCTNDLNLILPTYTSRAVKGLFENTLQDFDPLRMDGSGAGSTAAARIVDFAFSESGFVMVMNRKIGNGITTLGTFTFGDLLQLDPTIDNRTEVFGRSFEKGVISIPDGRNVNSLGDAYTIAVHATSIVQTTLALMSYAGVAILAFNANNMTNGYPEVTLQACDGLDSDGQLGNRLEVLKNRLVTECLTLVCAQQETFEVDVFADAFNDVFIEIYYDGDKAAYVVPAFAFSSLAPVVTNDLQHLVGMAEAIDNVVTDCRQFLDPTANTNMTLNFAQGDGEARVGGLSGDF